MPFFPLRIVLLCVYFIKSLPTWSSCLQVIELVKVIKFCVLKVYYCNSSTLINKTQFLNFEYPQRDNLVLQVMGNNVMSHTGNPGLVSMQAELKTCLPLSHAHCLYMCTLSFANI